MGRSPRSGCELACPATHHFLNPLAQAFSSTRFLQAIALFFCEVIPRACPPKLAPVRFPICLTSVCIRFFILSSSFIFILSLLKWTSLSLGLSLYSASLHVLHKVLTSIQPGREGREGREAEALKHFRYTTQDVNKAL